MATIRLQAAGAADPAEVFLEGTPAGGSVRMGAFEAEFEAGTIRPGAGWLRIAGRTLAYYSAPVDGGVQIWLEGRVHTFRRAEQGARRASAADAAGVLKDLTAPMPGTIVALQVGRGDRFEAHQPLVTMESMKMEMTLSAPSPGRVKEVLCDVGQLVDMNALLLRLERDDA